MVKIIKGDVTNPIADGYKVIVHCVNDLGQMGAGVALALLTKWPDVRKKYIEWYKDIYNFRLGEIQFVKVEESITVCNLIGQKGMGGEEIDGEFLPAIRYEAILEGMLRVRDRIRKSNRTDVSVHAPLLGCALAQGKLESIYEIVDTVFGQSDISFTFYAFSDQDFDNLCEIHDQYPIIGV